MSNVILQEDGTAIDRILAHAERIRNGLERVRPGDPYEISTAAMAGEGVWQGDLGLEIVEAIPPSHQLVEKLTEKDRQLVFGNTEGARHCIEDLSTVQLYKDPSWNEEDLFGPSFICLEKTTITHPTHGPVIIPKDFIIHTRYQRSQDAEEQRIRRARD